MTWTTGRAWLGTPLRLLLGVIWIWAAWTKLHHPLDFVQTVRAYDMTPEWLSRLVGYGLPVLEVCLGLVLVAGIIVRIAAAVSGVLFIVFLIALVQASARGIKIECGCFGIGGPTTGPTHYTIDILRVVVLLAVAAYLVVWSHTRISVEEFLARNDYVEAPSAKRMRSDQGRRKYQSQIAAKQAEARQRTMYITTSLAIIIALVSLVGAGVQSGRARLTGKIVTTNANVANGVIYGEAAAASVDIYEDFGCTACATLERKITPTLTKDVVGNLAQARYHPVSILNRISKNNYSSRAASAALCASDDTDDAFFAFHNLLFGKTKAGVVVQPKPFTAGPSNKVLVSYASAAGMSSTELSTFTACVAADSHAKLAAAINEDASKRGYTTLPIVLVNGVRLKSPTVASLQAAIKKADKKGPEPTPSPLKASTAPSASAAGSSAATAVGSPSVVGSSSAVSSPAVSSPAVSSPPATPSSTPASSGSSSP